MSKGLIIVGLIILILGLFIFFTEGFEVGRLQTEEVVAASLFVLAGLVLILLGGRRRERVNIPPGTSTTIPIDQSGPPQAGIIKERETEFQGTVVGRPYEVDAKKSFTYASQSGYVMKSKAGLKIRLLDQEGNPIGVKEVIFEPKDNYNALHDGDRVWIRGKWTKEGRVKVREAHNLTTASKVTRRSRFGWMKKAGVLIFVLVVLYLLYSFLGNLLDLGSFL